MCMSPLVPQTNLGATDLLTAVGFRLSIGFCFLCIGFRLCIGSCAALHDDVPDEMPLALRACPTPRLPDRRPGEACLAGNREGNFLVVISRACALCEGVAVADPTMRRPRPAT